MIKTGRPKSDNPKKLQVNVRLEENIYNEFTKKCKSININKSELVRKWIIDFIKEKK